MRERNNLLKFIWKAIKRLIYVMVYIVQECAMFLKETHRKIKEHDLNLQCVFYHCEIYN